MFMMVFYVSRLSEIMIHLWWIYVIRIQAILIKYLLVDYIEKKKTKLEVTKSCTY